MKTARNYTAVIEAAAFGAMARALYDESGDLSELFIVSPGVDLFGWCASDLIAPHYQANTDRAGLLRHSFGNPLDDETTSADSDTMKAANPLQVLALQYLDACCEGLQSLAATLEERTGFTHHVATVGANTCGDWDGFSFEEIDGFTVWTDEDGNRHAEIGGEIWLHSTAGECEWA